MTTDADIKQVREIKERYEEELMSRANVVGLGIGYRYKDGQSTGEVVLIVNVSDKKPVAELAEKDLIPSEIEGVPVDVQEVGQIRAF